MRYFIKIKIISQSDYNNMLQEYYKKEKLKYYTFLQKFKILLTYS